MDRPILVPLDGSRRAEKALAQALALADACGSSIHLARVHVDPPLFGARGVSQDALAGWQSDLAEVAARAERYLHEVATRVQAVLGAGRVRVTLVRDEPDVVHALTRLARRIHAGSIVIASRDRSPFARLAWFSVADGLIRRSGLPVMVITDRTGPRWVRKVPRILLPVTAVTENDAALSVAADFARSCGAVVTLARVIEADRGTGSGRGAALVERADPASAAALQDLAAASGILGTAAGGDAQLLRHHDRVEAILHIAESLHADLILMPTRRRGGLEILLGSTASGVLRGADIPVVIIGARAGTSEAEPPAGLGDVMEDEPALFV